MTTKAPSPKPAEVVVAVAAFAHPTGSVQKGSRLPADDPVAIQYSPFFLPLGQDTEEALLERLLELHPPPAAPSPAPASVVAPPPIADADALICIRDCSHGSEVARAGSKVDRHSKLARENPSAFVPMTRGVRRDRALVATAECKSYGSDGDTGGVTLKGHIYPGQWADKDDPEVVARPYHFIDMEPA